MVGIDTPEQGRCASAQATRALGRALSRGERVTLVSDPGQGNRDRYGRLLRYVIDGGTDVNRLQLVRGWARVFVVGSGFDRLRPYRRAQMRAKRADRGLWGRCGSFPG